MTTTKRKSRKDEGLSVPMAFSYGQQQGLSEFVAKPSEGRLKPISRERMRDEYERDYHRILYSSAFRRLRHKTQVFYAPQNDHICTRLDHSLQVASISETICRKLRLWVDLAKAIALGHDLGHAPFGHTGEDILNKICIEKGLGPFMHEANSLRVADMMKELHGETLRLTYEVRDGIVCHCGEKPTQLVKPERGKDVTLVNTKAAHVQNPYTLEGCVVRYADAVAYLPADLQDALELGVILKADRPKEVKQLGNDSGEIIARITEDIIRVSADKDYIATSGSVFERMQKFHEFSQERIYKCSIIEKSKRRINNIITDLFEELLEALMKTSRGKDKKLRNRYDRQIVYRAFFDFIDSMKYSEDELPVQIVLDYVAGMTDNFALRCYDEICQISAPIRLR